MQRNFNYLDMKNCINVLFKFFVVRRAESADLSRERDTTTERRKKRRTTAAAASSAKSKNSVMTNDQQQPPVACDHVCSTLLLSSCSRLMISINNKKQIIFIMFPILSFCVFGLFYIKKLLFRSHRAHTTDPGSSNLGEVNRRTAEEQKREMIAVAEEVLKKVCGSRCRLLLVVRAKYHTFISGRI